MDARRTSALAALLAPLFAAALAVTQAAGASAGSAVGNAPANAGLTSAAPTTGAPARVLVRFRPATTAAERAGLFHAVGATEIGTIPDLHVHVLAVPHGAEQHVADTLARSSGVAFAERDSQVSAADVVPNDPYWANQWGPKKIGSPTGWSTATGSSSVVVAVLDTGLNATLPEFAGRVLPGYNFVANSTGTSDDNSHGTAVTGIALAQGKNGSGIAGMCWTCSILPVKVLGSDGTGTASTIASGVTWAADHGARVINLSLGSTSSSSTEASAVSYAQSKGALVVAAAGNNSSSSPFFPAAYPGVLSVAASDQYDGLYSYSDFGAWVDVAAPGSNYSVWPSGSCYNFGGTSSATPLVTGLAALLLSAKPTASATDVAAAITYSADPLAAGVVATGRVDAAKALASFSTGLAPPATSTAPSSPTPSPSASPSPAPSPTPSSSATPTTASSTSSSGPAPAVTTTSFSGSLAGGASKTFALTTAGGAATAYVSGTAATVTLSLISGTGSVLATSSGGSGTTVSANVPSGSFSVLIKAAGKTKFKVAVTYYT
jgi:hypothetical protein